MAVGLMSSTTEQISARRFVQAWCRFKDAEKIKQKKETDEYQVLLLQVRYELWIVSSEEKHVELTAGMCLGLALVSTRSDGFPAEAGAERPHRPNLSRAWIMLTRLG